ncbi:type IV-A pilus assembly ATPase PilB [Chromohalobacter israelensis]
MPLSSSSTSDTEASPLKGLAARLVREGLLEERQARSALEAVRESHQSMLEYVIERQWVPARAATQAAAWEYGLPFVDLEAVDLGRLPIGDGLPDAMIRRLGVLPLARSERHISVAVPYPATLAKLDELQFSTGLTAEGVLVAVDQLQPAIDSHLAQRETHGMLEALDDASEALETLDLDDVEPLEDGLGTDDDDAPVVRFVHKMMIDAARRGASDIHFEPYESTFRIRFRIDGILVEVARPPFNLRARLSARLKVMSRLDISERRLPQDGAIKLRLSASRTIDFRVSTLPTVHGEKIVLRLLDAGATRLGIDALGFSEAQRAMFEHALAQPQGMILATGPTGSGKTVTLYTGLNILNTDARNISTAEDPVELKLDGINQVSVQPKIGLDFANALRAFLRQDPDVVMVGEVRDLETAEIAVKAAQTGHLVLSTLHTNSAAETLTRLRNMGVAAYNIASSVSLIVAQRLVRQLCPHCKTPVELPRELFIEAGFTSTDIESTTCYRAVGCAQCTHGYKGRVGIYEVLPVSEAMSKLIMADGNSLELGELARQEGHPDLRRSGLSKVLAGITSLEEINRVVLE